MLKQIQIDLTNCQDVPKPPPCRQQLLQAVNFWVVVAPVAKHKAHSVLQQVTHTTEGQRAGQGIYVEWG
jgi:hypothetical protein